MPVSDKIIPLKNIYQARIDLLTDVLDAAKANVAIDSWQMAETAYQEILEATATNYSTTGRTITKRSIESARNARNQAIADLEGYLGTADAGVTYVDNGGIIS